MTAFKPQPTPSSPARFAPCGAFLCLQFMPCLPDSLCPAAPQSVQVYTEKKSPRSARFICALHLPNTIHRAGSGHKSKSAGSLHLPSVRRLETMRIACWKGCALGRAGHKPAAPQERKGCSFLALCILHTYAASCGYVSTGQCSTPRFARTKPYASLRSHHRSVHAHKTGG